MRTNQKRRQFRSNMVNDLDTKLRAWQRKRNLSLVDVSRLLTKVFDGYDKWTSVHESICEMLNGRHCSDTLSANLVQLMKDLDEKTITILLRNRREGFKETPEGQSLESRLEVFKDRKDAGGRFVARHMRKVM